MRLQRYRTFAEIDKMQLFLDDVEEAETVQILFIERGFAEAA